MRLMSGRCTKLMTECFTSREYAREVRIAGGGNLFAHIAEALRAKRRADVWAAGLARRNAAVPLSDAVSRADATPGDTDAELEVWCVRRATLTSTGPRLFSTFRPSRQ